MSRRLIFLRHADAPKAGIPASDRRARDARPLSERGRAQASAAGRFMADQGLRVDALVTTGTRRTQETAEIALAELPAPPTARWTSPGGRDAAALLARASEWMASLPPDGALLFSGHGPNLKHLLGHLRCPSSALADEHGAALVLRLEGGEWRLEALHPRRR